MAMVTRTRYGLGLLALSAFGLISGCTSILGVDTSYEENPCSGPDAYALEPLECGKGACHVLIPRCDANGLPVNTCVEGEPEDKDTCDGIDNNCDGQVDEGCKCEKDEEGHAKAQTCYRGSPETRGIGACKDGKQVCQLATGLWSLCEDDVLPQPEVCDKIDNDCDGEVDEGCPCSDGQQQVCYGGPVSTRGVSPCKDGTQVCNNGTWGACEGDTLPAIEVCDGFDDDCDGAIDNGCPCVNGEERQCYTGPEATKNVGICKPGAQKCNKGVWGDCIGQVLPKPVEICNGQDDDCNGINDDGQVGGTEICDGIDNDCDGLIDEGDPGGGMSCDTGKPGPCSDGTTSCVQGAVTCKQKVQASQESCDGIDNDCNGTIDDNNPGGGGTCPVPGLSGICAVGTKKCQSGQIVCEQTVIATTEKCNGLDDDCDGSTDEGNPESGGMCNTGKPGACSEGLFDCSGTVLVCKQIKQPTPETCDGIDNDCDSQTDEGNPEGGAPCTTGLPGICANGTKVCQNGVLQCEQLVSSSAEKCNGLDDDCNGQTDEGNPGGGTDCTTNKPGICAAGTTACTGGQLVCNSKNLPVAEVCDGLDNNCDGTADEGNPGGGATCNTGKPGVCAAGSTLCTGGQLVCQQIAQASAEKCDGLDNDCDGQTDEIFANIGQTCTNGLGECQGAGVFVCKADGSGTECNAVVGAPVPESCDGKDNDCDGQTDEGNPGSGAPCDTLNLGVCKAGTTTCSNGAIICQQNIQPSAEKCDGLDNDCNGSADEGNPGGGGVCDTGLLGVCKGGTSLCSGGQIICKQDVQVSTEKCDGLDNDCDGQTDENFTNLGKNCTSGLGVCQQSGIYACKADGSGTVCDAVAGMPSTEICDGKDNDCDGSTDEDFTNLNQSCTSGVGVCQTSGTFVCKTDGTGTMCNAVPGNPATEICDGKDNDCNGAIDDGFNLGTPCTAGTGECAATGVYVCGTNGAAKCSATPGSPVAEICDGKDNDCDGTVDDGNPGAGLQCTVAGAKGLCANGLTGACTNGANACEQKIFPTSELCDGKDNDCNGTVDDGFNVGATCTVGTGECIATGVYVCDTNGAAKCSATPGSPVAETCDGKDNDCDGMVDDGNPGAGLQCMVTGAKGLCANGLTGACTNGANACEQKIFPTSELCDGKDNDCNGTVDDGFNVGATCTAGTGECIATGVYVCDTNGAAKCSATPGSPVAEICDGKDNDCDGTVDDGFNVGNACTVGIGACEKTGQFVCTTDNTATTCSVTAGLPGTEVCGTAIDEDCDGTISQVLFSETFFDGGPGWSMTGSWEVKAAAAGCANSADPATDHTNTADNMLAGVKVGDCVNAGGFTSGTLTSPTIDTSGATGVYLQFWRWLNSSKNMTNKIEASTDNGATWASVNSLSGPISETAWSKVSFDLSQYKSTQMKIRWSYSYTGQEDYGGWNIDDILITTEDCN